METNTNLINLFSKYENRKTKEPIEIIAFHCEDIGARSVNDWVTYIDSNGEEHIKEHLHLYLDFKIIQEMPDYLKNMFDKVNTFDNKYPSSYNNRYYDLAKELYLHKACTMDEAMRLAKEFVDKTKNEYEYGQEENNTKTC